MSCHVRIAMLPVTHDLSLYFAKNFNATRNVSPLVNYFILYFIETFKANDFCMYLY